MFRLQTHMEMIIRNLLQGETTVMNTKPDKRGPHGPLPVKLSKVHKAYM